jgi:GGDEF domain-containing protein
MGESYMMRRVHFLLLFVIQLLCLILLTLVTGPTEVLFYDFVVMALAIPFYFLRPLPGFSLLVAAVSALGFVYVSRAWVMHWSVLAQANGIAVHLIVTVLLVAIWVNAILLRRMHAEYRAVQRELQEFLKYEDVPGLLTANELRYRLEDLSVGARRRREHGWLMVVRLHPEGRRYIVRPAMDKIAAACVQSVRNKFDVVGRISENEIGVVLQNADRTGAAVVQERIRGKLEQVFQQPLLDGIDITVLHIVDDWSVITSKLAMVSGGTGAAINARTVGEARP